MVESQTPREHETPPREAWTDAQPRESPVPYSPPSLPGAEAMSGKPAPSAEVGTPQLPDATASNQAGLCKPMRKCEVPEEVAPEPESKRDPMYWRFLDQHQYQSQQVEMGVVCLDMFR